MPNGRYQETNKWRTVIFSSPTANNKMNISTGLHINLWLTALLSTVCADFGIDGTCECAQYVSFRTLLYNCRTADLTVAMHIIFSSPKLYFPSSNFFPFSLSYYFRFPAKYISLTKLYSLQILSHILFPDIFPSNFITYFTLHSFSLNYTFVF